MIQPKLATGDLLYRSMGVQEIQFGSVIPPMKSNWNSLFGALIGGKQFRSVLVMLGLMFKVYPNV